MTDAHKAALAEGRKQSREIKAYLEALGARKPGRPVTKDSLTKRLEGVNTKIAGSDNPLDTVELIQSRLEIEKTLSELGSGDDFPALEKGFVSNAAAYSERKGISYTAWREIGVPASVLKSAGIKETRRR